MPAGDTSASGRHWAAAAAESGRNLVHRQLPVAVAIEHRERPDGAGDLVGRDRAILIRVEGEDERIALLPSRPALFLSNDLSIAASSSLFQQPCRKRERLPTWRHSTTAL